MSTYSEFVRNPWNFLLRTLMVKVDEKAIEAMVKHGTSDVNYRNLLLYQNNPHSAVKQVLSYDMLSNVTNITVVMYIFDLDAYIIDNPYNITYSCMSHITVITKQCTNSYDVVKDKSMYGLYNLYCVLSRTFKIVYNADNSKVYLEGNSSSKFHLFQRIDKWTGNASIRIYSTTRCSMAKPKFVNGICPPVVPVPSNTEPLYSFISLPQRVIEDHSYGLDVLNKILSSDKFTAASLYMTRPIYSTGISVQDLANIDKYILENKKIGILTERNYDNNIKSYSCRLMSYGTLIVLKDTLIGLFINSNSKTPFESVGQSRECVFMYMNHYCYYIGRTDRTLYTFNNSTVSIYEACKDSTTSKLSICLKDMSYVLYGDFIRSCNTALIPSDTQFGVCRQYLYRNINDNLNFIYR